MHSLIKEWKITGKAKEYLPLKIAFLKKTMSPLIYVYASIYVAAFSSLLQE